MLLDTDGVLCTSQYTDGFILFSFSKSLGCIGAVAYPEYQISSAFSFRFFF